MKTSRNHISSLLSAIVFALAALLLFGIALLMGFTILASILKGRGIRAEQTILLVAFGFEALPLLVATFFTFQKYIRNPAADQSVSLSLPSRLVTYLVLIAFVSILIGFQIGGNRQVNWLILPILTIPASVFPLVALLAIGTKQLPYGTRSQAWSVLGFAMTLGPLVMIILEILVGIIIFIGIVVYVINQPELAARLQALSQQIMVLGPQSQAASELLAPLITKPIVIVPALVYISILVPALEEVFKPLGVWLFAGKLESQAQGFALGALSGASYALIETIGNSGQTAEWGSLLCARIGTGLLHTTTSALMGAAIVLAWRERRILRLLGTYFLAILLHGLWNSFAILLTLSGIATTLRQGGGLSMSMVQPAMTFAMVALAIVLFTILVASNRKMRATLPPSPVQTVIPEENTGTGEST